MQVYCVVSELGPDDALGNDIGRYVYPMLSPFRENRK